MCNFAYFADLFGTNFLRLLLLILLIFFLFFVGLFGLFETDFTFFIPVAIAAIGKDKALPLGISLQFLDNPFPENNGWFNLFFLWFEHVGGDLGQILGLEEEGRGESFDSNVEHSVLRCF